MSTSKELDPFESKSSVRFLGCVPALDDGWNGLFVYSLVFVPALDDLLPKSGISRTTANVGYYGGLLALFMIGYGFALAWSDR